jgi:predicted DNA-binding WGR domain protein
MPARRFEFEEGSSSKFWAIERNARKVTVTFGRIGSTGQEKTKAFPTDAKATAEEEKLIAEKLRKGYSEVKGAKAQKKDEEADTDGDEDEEEDDGEPKPPPPGFSKPTSWDAIAKAWSGVGKARGAKVRASDVKGALKALGIPRFPPSYLVYLERFKKLGELEQRYEREDFPHFLNIYTPDWLEEQRGHFLEHLEMDFDMWTAEAKKIVTAARKLIPFGYDTSRTDICWDPARKTPNGEMTICFYHHDYARRTNAGPDLKEVLKYYKPHGR